MKNIMLITILMIAFSCEPLEVDIEETAIAEETNDDFNFTTIPDDSSVQFTMPINFNFDIVPSSNVQEENNGSYFLKFELPGLRSTFFYESKDYLPGEIIEINELNFEGALKVKEPGSSDVKFTITSSNGVSKETTKKVEINPIDFEFYILPLPGSPVDSDVPLFFEVIEEENSIDKYEVRYNYNPEIFFGQLYFAKEDGTRGERFPTNRYVEMSKSFILIVDTEPLADNVEVFPLTFTVRNSTTEKDFSFF